MAKILTVDDEPHIIRLMQINLEKAGYTVVTAADGREGLSKVAAERPDLVVMDVMMPYMDGFEALSQLRRDPATRDLPVIMLPGKAMDSDVAAGYRTGADCYLTKPFNPRELLAFVKRILEFKDPDEDRRYTI
jgi:two-component system alkaline phosphatase synthesis response regulator PhoP/two-component system response regulator VicR